MKIFKSFLTIMAVLLCTSQLLAGSAIVRAKKPKAAKVLQIEREVPAKQFESLNVKLSDKKLLKFKISPNSGYWIEQIDTYTFRLIPKSKVK